MAGLRLGTDRFHCDCILCFCEHNLFSLCVTLVAGFLLACAQLVWPTHPSTQMCIWSLISSIHSVKPAASVSG